MNSKKLILKGAIATFFSVALMFSSCEKKAVIEEAANNDEATADDNQEADAVGNESQNIADAYYANPNNGLYKLEANEIIEASGCATVTHDTLNGILTIDFGPTNCLCKDGRNRKGKIIVAYTGGKYKNVGSTRTITFDNFYRNNNKIEGTRTVTNIGINSNGNYHWEVVETGMKITRADGKIHTWTSTRDRELSAGLSTPFNWTDDEYTITGSASGTNKNNIGYSATITKPLHRSMNCNWFSSGVIEFVNAANGKTRTLDYGSGTCDSDATVTVTAKNGKTTTKNITLK